jgi:tetrapyrrole methylase family protein/MazG family protein
VDAPATAPQVVVAGLGPGPDDLVTAGTLDAIAAHPPERRFLRTARHPSAHLAGPGVTSFDEHYDRAATFEEVYRRIVDDLVAAALRIPGAPCGGTGAGARSVLYLVPGSPAVLERSVDLLRADPRVSTTVLGAMSFVDLAWVRLGVDPLDDGVRLVDAHRFAERAAGERGPLLVAHCHNRRVLSDVKLAFEGATPPSAVVLARLGLPDEAVFDVPWDDLDRSFAPDHLTSLWIPEVAAPVGAELVRFAEVVARLRRECPWDREQTHASLRRYLLEESYEVLEAIDHLEAAQADDGAVADAEGALVEELGDLLFQVYFHAAIGAERGTFTLADVAAGIADKLVSRHPHVFAGADADESMAAWDEMKRAEKGRTSAMDGVSDALPALALASKVLTRCARHGVDWRDLVDPDDAARPFLELVDAARAGGDDAEDALRRAATRLRDAARARGV